MEKSESGKGIGDGEKSETFEEEEDASGGHLKLPTVSFPGFCSSVGSEKQGA